MNATQDVSAVDEREKTRLKRRVIKNLLIFSISLLFPVSSVHGLQNLQSSLNSASNVGIVVLVVSTITHILTMLFLPIVVAKSLRLKWPLVFVHLSVQLVIVFHYFPSFYTLVIAAILQGVSTSIMFSFYSILIKHLASDYALLAKADPTQILTRFLAVFSSIMRLSKQKLALFIFKKR
jgi:hypothetical protein